MKRLKCSNPKIRTVTQVVSSNEKLGKDYDLTDFDAKNRNSLESYNALKIKLVLVKYMAMLNTLKLTQPLLTIFRDKTAQHEIVTIILASLGFVHNRVNPMVNNFDNKMEFVVVENRQDVIPGEPIVFRQNENDEIVCMIDRLSIMRMLERQFDTDVSVTSIMREQNKVKLMKAFSSAGTKRRCSDASNNDSSLALDIRLTETDCTRYVTLLFIVEHAYCHYVIFKNDGAINYIQSLTNHQLFASKCRPTFNMTFNNLLLSKIKFNIEDPAHGGSLYKSNGCNLSSGATAISSSSAVGILNYTN